MRRNSIYCLYCNIKSYFAICRSLCQLNTPVNNHVICKMRNCGMRKVQESPAEARVTRDSSAWIKTPWQIILSSSIPAVDFLLMVNRGVTKRRTGHTVRTSHNSTALIYLIRAVHRCTTQLVAHGKWNYCVRIVIKVANFEINRGRTSLI